MDGRGSKNVNLTYSESLYTILFVYDTIQLKQVAKRGRTRSKNTHLTIKHSDYSEYTVYTLHYTVQTSGREGEQQQKCEIHKQNHIV